MNTVAYRHLPIPSSHPARQFPDSVNDLPTAVHDFKAPAFAGVLGGVIVHHALRDGPCHSHHFYVETPSNLWQGPERLWVNRHPGHKPDLRQRACSQIPGLLSSLRATAGPAPVTGNSPLPQPLRSITCTCNHPAWLGAKFASLPLAFWTHLRSHLSLEGVHEQSKGSYHILPRVVYFPCSYIFIHLLLWSNTCPMGIPRQRVQRSCRLGWVKLIQEPTVCQEMH